MPVLSIMRTLSLFALVALALFSISCDNAPPARAAVPSDSSKSERTAMNTPTAKIRVINKDGKLSEPVEAPKLVLSDAEWQKRLTKEQYKIGRAKGTEPAFCGGLLNNHEA